jgi:DNA-binding HxlR family transcriptional regulator
MVALPLTTSASLVADTAVLLVTAPSASAKRPTALERGGDNAVAVALGLIGDEWNLWILREALQGATRYNDWLRAGPISNSVLTQRLSRLAEMEVLSRVEYQSRPVRYAYTLTSRGRDVWPILLTMWWWERTWVPEIHEALPQMRHTRCGSAFEPMLICASCKEPVKPRDVVGRLGPSGAWARSVPASSSRRRSGAGRPPAQIPQTMSIVGNRWSSALLGAAFLGATRFGEFAQRMGAPPTIVAQRLRTLCDEGVLAATPSSERADWVTYHLTDKGRAFFPILICTLDWGQRWYRAPEGRAVLYKHSGCGRSFHPKLACSACKELLRGHEISVEPA